MDLAMSELEVSPPAWVPPSITLDSSISGRMLSVVKGRHESELADLFCGVGDCAWRGKMDNMVESPCRPERRLTGRRNMTKAKGLYLLRNVRKKEEVKVFEPRSTRGYGTGYERATHACMTSTTHPMKPTDEQQYV